jgi:quinol monooxygenase YgiN
MSTHVVNEFHAKPGRGDDVLALLLELSPESRGRPGCEAISIRRNQDDPDNLIGDTRWATRQHSTTTSPGARRTDTQPTSIRRSASRC